LVDRFMSKDGFNEPSAKTNRLLDGCRRRNSGGPFIGRGPSTNCGRKSTIASVSSRNRPLVLARRRMPAAKSSLTRKPLVPARRLLLVLARRRLLLALARRRLPAAKSSSTSKPFMPARRLLLALARRRLLLALARRRLHVANAPLKHARRLPPNSSSCGSAAVVSMPGSLARPHGDSSARPLLPASTTRTNALLVRCR
jgi:hypothetical protein